MENEKIVQALKELAAEHKAHIEFVHNIEELAGIVVCNNVNEYVHLHTGLIESGLTLERKEKYSKGYPTQYETEIDGVRFIQLSPEPFEKE